MSHEMQASEVVALSVQLLSHFWRGLHLIVYYILVQIHSQS